MKKINKLKSLSIAVWCAVAALLAEIQGAEEQRDEPAGIINSFAGEIAPNGWLLCDGQPCFSREYPKLYEVVKTKYVPSNEKLEFLEFNENNDNKKFRVPDLRGRVIVGVDGGTGRVTVNNTLGASGGDENVILAINNIPIHDHVVKCSPQTQLGGQYPGDILVPNGSPRGTQNRHTDSAGGSQPHNNMQPYQVLNYIISTGQANRQQQSEILRLKQKIDQLEISQLDQNQHLEKKLENKIKQSVLLLGNKNQEILDLKIQLSEIQKKEEVEQLKKQEILTLREITRLDECINLYKILVNPTYTYGELAKLFDKLKEQYRHRTYDTESYKLISKMRNERFMEKLNDVDKRGSFYHYSTCLAEHVINKLHPHNIFILKELLNTIKDDVLESMELYYINHGKHHARWAEFSKL